MKWWVDRFTQEMKEIVTARMELIDKRESIKESFKGGEAFFSKQVKSPSASDLVRGTERMMELFKELDEVDAQIKDVDTVIVSKLEMYLGNFTARARMTQRMSDAGDVIKHDEIYLVPFKTDDENLIEVTPDDIWFLKMIKQAYKATNITFEGKGE